MLKFLKSILCYLNFDPNNRKISKNRPNFTPFLAIFTPITPQNLTKFVKFPNLRPLLPCWANGTSPSLVMSVPYCATFGTLYPNEFAYNSTMVREYTAL